MVVRPAAEAVMEVFMVRRHSRSKFLPDMYVFPGGALDPEDSLPRSLSRLFPQPQVERLYRDLPEEGAYDQVVPVSPEQEKGLFVATYRELFEEAGVLLTLRESDKEHYHVQESEERLKLFADYRKKLHAKELSFVDILEQEKLLLDFSRLIYYSHWITPLIEPIRFDTRFFVALAEPDQIAESDFLETTHGLWVSPRQALSNYEAGNFNLIYPTILHLRRLAIHESIESMLETARTKTIIPVSPDALRLEEGLDFKLPGSVLDKW
jgi:8-oxo-dGTP pyrophosphatase MutT (NUDIX family)